MINLDPEDKTALENALRDLDYPATRGKLVELANENKALGHAIAAILELPETADFHDPAQLREALGIDVPGVKPTGGWE